MVEVPHSNRSGFRRHDVGRSEDLPRRACSVVGALGETIEQWGVLVYLVDILQERLS